MDRMQPCGTTHHLGDRAMLEDLYGYCTFLSAAPGQFSTRFVENVPTNRDVASLGYIASHDSVLRSIFNALQIKSTSRAFQDLNINRYFYGPNRTVFIF